LPAPLALYGFDTYYSTLPVLGCSAECIPNEGDHMEPNGNDKLIEAIDKELRAIDARLKKVLSKTDSLLKESASELNEAEKGQDGKED
jgi:hypothetical protein